MARISWDHYFMAIARQVSSRSTCPRRSVGAVIVRDRTILSTGYNGSVRGMPHCEDVGCLLENNHCVTTVHAEANAILQAAFNGVSIKDADIYSTSQPCWNCFKLIVNSGIRRVFYMDAYADERTFRFAEASGISLIHLPETPDS
ncbi:MAG TPA: cytidine/deoxycytidylate deaminase family protein [Thermoanaerobaculia bacterium]|nr:cytidine/deoxycytidylate deaminase family protein [Thermoanaerobaculia bacterium]HUM29373.1 cytidine/deoxycytidylate deaminase family protein [Thermoanaerobaculia bacterium]HXK67619.1 cytidine/deoxycytidylate deaminase family protein [Thermoanaerobaculia bacterium]